MDCGSDCLIKTEKFIAKIVSLSFISVDERMDIYTSVFNAMTLMTGSGVRLRDSILLGASDLHDHIVQCLTEQINNIRENAHHMTDEDLLCFYRTHLEKYKGVCIWMNGAFHYVNIYYDTFDTPTTKKRDENKVGVMAERIWEELFFVPLLPSVVQICLNIVDTCRKNGYSSVDSQTIEKILQLFANPDLNQTINQSSTRSIYEECFEAPFLHNAEEFYRQRPSVKGSSSVKDLSEIARYYDSEISFAQSFVPGTKSTLAKLIEKLDKIFSIDVRAEIVSEDIRKLLSTPKKLIPYKSIIGIPKMRQTLLSTIANHIYEQGIDTIASEHTRSDPGIYVDTIIDIRDSLFKLLQIFEDEQSLIAILDSVCARLINNNAVTKATDTTKKPAELLARYCDQFLRKGNSTTEELDVGKRIEKMMIVFNCLEDKDVFEKFYRQLLAKRLLNQLSVSYDDEGAAISKLKQLCGSAYTAKLEQMLKDILVSGTLTQQYQTSSQAKENFSVMVLSSNSWSENNRLSFTLPIELQQLFDSFIAFYATQHPQKKLTCLHQHSHGQLQLLYTNLEYIVHVSTYQMAILLLFNRASQWTVEQIYDETHIESNILYQVLDSLFKAKLLVCDETDASKRSIIELAAHFQSEKIKIKVITPIKFTPSKVSDKFMTEVIEERQFVIQAAIVRVMKAKQKLKFNTLIEKVMEHLSSRFKPDVRQIKKCIDILIEKDYLQRISDDKEMLCYVT